MLVRGVLFIVLLAGGAIGPLLVSTSASAETPAVRYDFDIPAQDLSDALATFGRVCNQQLAFDKALVRDKKNQPLRGNFTAEEGMAHLLDGSGLTFKRTESGVFVIQRLERAKTNDQAPPLAATVGPSASEGLEEILVTGTHIRGAEAAGSKLITITQDDIEKSGYARIEDIMATVTQNFQGVSETYNQPGANNLAFGTEVQLRGLGPGTTLTLVNGQRQAAGGTSGDFVDISSIPAAAIDRIEILPEGASALYGSDAIGGVVNIILRKDFDGFETRLRGSTAAGDVANGLQASQVWGTTWSTGNFLVGYQYDERKDLPASSRTYSAANMNFTAFGGTNYLSYYGLYGSNPGEILNPATYQPVAAIPPGQNGTHLTASQLLPGVVNYENFVADQDLLPRQKTQSAFFSATQKISDQWELSLDGRFNTRHYNYLQPNEQTAVSVPASNAFNNLGGPVLVAYDFTDDLGPGTQYGTTDTYAVSAQAIGSLPGKWQLTLSSNYATETNDFYWINGLNQSALAAALADSNPATALNVFGDGSHTNPATLATLRTAPEFYQGRSTIASFDALVDGSLFDLPAGAAKLAVGADYRHERQSTSSAVSGVSSYLEGSRDVTALFSELALPVIGPQSAFGKMDLSLAGRYENYSDVGTTINPKIGFGWSPLSFLKVRGTWGTSFQAPPFSYTGSFAPASAGVATVTDPASSTGVSRVLVEGGVVPNLTPEKAHVWTAGLDIAPSSLEGLVVSATLWNVNFQEKITYPPSYYNFLTQPAIYAPLIINNPTQAQINAVCAAGVVVYGGTCTGSFAALLDDRARNLSAVSTEGLDASVKYSLKTSHGTWGIGVNGTYTFTYKTQIINTAPFFDVVNTLNYPLKLRAAGHVSWAQGGWFAQSTVNFTGGYEDPNFSPYRNINSWTTLDLTAGYRINNSQSWLNKSRIVLAATNVLNKAPPFVNEYGFGYDTANASLIGRQLSLQLVKEW